MVGDGDGGEGRDECEADEGSDYCLAFYARYVGEGYAADDLAAEDAAADNA